MKTFGELYNHALEYLLIKEQEDAAMVNDAPLGNSPEEGTEQKDYMKPNKDKEDLVDALKRMIQIGQQALDKNKEYKNDQDANKEKDDDEKEMVSRPGSDGVADMFGKEQ